MTSARREPGSRRRRRTGLAAALVAVVAAVLVAGVAAAHPLGNFTINHYAGLRLETDRIVLDVVIDEAEIPAFQRRQALDTDLDGSVSDEEAAAGMATLCPELGSALELTLDGTALPISVTAAGLTFPLGASGLSTLRLVCTFESALPAPLSTHSASRISFADRSSPERLGWREIVVTGDGVAATGVDGDLRTSSPSQRLTAYPEELISQPLTDLAVSIAALADPSVSAPPLDIPDAMPVTPVPVGGAAAPVAPAETTVPAATAPAPASAAVVPGGIDGEIPSIFSTRDLTPFVLLLSLITAAALGAAHALTPGHGKTLMATYLVGTNGRPLHAVALGLSVSVSHTVGILVLAALVVGAADVLPPDLVVRAAPVIAAVSILVIGAWMLIGEWRHRRAPAVAHDHHGRPVADGDHGPHTRGGHTHAHAPGTSVGWRGLVALGLAGGLIPSTSALLILLGAIAAGRPGVGFVLVVAFGLGMAVVLGGIGLAMVLARDRFDRASVGPRLARARTLVPLAAAVLVFGFGIWLTVQAVASAPVL